MSDEELLQLEEVVRERGETMTTVESCTGGLCAGRLTDIAGSSDILKMAFVTYCDEAKHQLVGVSEETLEKYTAVSDQTCREMLLGGAETANAQAVLSFTGYAGPAAPDDESSGLVYTGCYYRGKITIKENHFKGSPQGIREQAVNTGLEILKTR